MDVREKAVVSNAIYHVSVALLSSGAVKATKYISPKSTVKGKRKEFRGQSSRSRTTEIHVTFGAPNYEEREFIKRCKKSGEPFPVKKIQLKFAKAKVREKKAA